MRYITARFGVSSLGVLFLAVMPAFADTAAGLAAFKNKDYEKAFREWKAAAEAGQAEAQFDLGVLYAKGLGVLRDLTVAVDWYRKAAQQGNAEAQFALGQMYARGWGVPRDVADAIRWFDLANSPDSDGPPTDYLPLEGYGMPQDMEQAAYWYQQAADKSHAEAEYFLGELYSSGKGVKRDEEQAARWVSVSAVQGYAPAMANIGKRYALGNGVTKDDKRAYFWLTLAFLHSDKSAEKLRTAEAGKLKPEDVQDQDRAAQNWKPRLASARVKQ
jgi:TPR repeat protein